MFLQNATLKRGLMTLTLLLGLSFLSVHSAEAATYQWDGGGGDNNWSTAENWDGDVVPGTADIVQVNSTSSKNIHLDVDIDVARLTFSNDYAGAISTDAITITTKRFNAWSADVDFSGVTSMDIGDGDGAEALKIQNGGVFTAPSVITVEGAIYLAADSTFVHNNGTITMDGSSAAGVSLWAGTGSFYNLIFDKALETTAVTNTTDASNPIEVENDFTLRTGDWARGLVEVQGDLTFESTISGDIGAKIDTITLTGSNDQDVTATGITNELEGLQFKVNKSGGTASLQSNIDLYTANNGDFFMQGGTFALNGYTLNTAIFNQTGGTFDGGTGTLDMDGTSSAADFILSGGVFNAPENVLLSLPNWNQTGGTYNHGNNTITLDGATDTRFKSSVDALYSITESKSSTTEGLELGTGVNLVLEGNLSITNAFKQVDSTTSIEIHGDFTMGESATSCAPPITFAGANDQNFNATGSEDLCNGNLVVNKSGGTLTFLSDIDVDGSSQSFELQSGTISGGGTQTLNTREFTQSGGTIQDFAAFTTELPGIVNVTAGTFSAPTTASILSNQASMVFTPTTFTHNSGQFTIQNNNTLGAGQTWDFSDGIEFYNMTLAAGTASNKWTMASADAITVHDLTVSGGALNTNAGSELITVTGDLNLQAAYANGTLPFTLSGTESQVLTLGDANDLNADLVVNKTGGAVNLGSALTLNQAGQSFVIEEGNFDLNGYALTRDSTASITVEDGGVLRLQGAETITMNATNPTLQAGSNVVYDGATAECTNCNPQDWTYDSIEFNSSDGGGSFQLSGSLTVSEDFTLNAGTFNQNSQTLTVNGLNTCEINGGTFNQSASVSCAGNFIQTNGTWNGSANNLDIDGNFDQSGGTFVAPTGAFTLAGDFTHSAGTWTENGSNLQLDGVNQTLTGSTSFNDLTKVDNTNDSTDRDLVLTSGDTMTINGTLTLAGIDADDRLNIVATSAGTEGYFDFQGTANLSTTGYLDITDNHALDNSTNVSTPIEPANSTNGGNTDGWFAVNETVSGTAYTDNGVTVANTKAVALSINGAAPSTTTTNGSGVFTFSGLNLTAGDILTIYFDGEAEKGVVVMAASGVDETGVDLFANNLIVRDSSGAGVSSSDLDTANDSGDLDIDAIYTIDGSNVVSTGTGVQLYVWSGDTYTPGAALNLEGGLVIDGTLNAAANAVNITGDFTNNGTFTHSGILTFDGTDPQYLLPGGLAIGSDIVISNTSAEIELGANLNIGANDLTISASATLKAGGNNITASGTYSNEGTLQLNGDENLTLTQDTNSGTVEYQGDGTGAATTHALLDFGGSDYYNLVINDTSASNSDTFRADAALNVLNNLTVVDGSLDTNDQTTTITGNVTIAVAGSMTAGSSDLSLAGDWSNDGSFTPETSEVTLDSCGANLNGSSTFYNLTMADNNNDSTNCVLTLESGEIQSINGVLTLNGLDVNDNLEIVASSAGNAATFYMQGSSSFSTTGYLDITDNTISDNSSAFTVPVFPANSTDGGGNTNWFGSTVAGTIYSDAGVTTINTGKTIAVSINGGAVTTGETNGSGQYSITISETISSGDIVTIYLDDETENGVTVVRADGSTLTGMNIYQDMLIVRSSDGGNVTSANLNTANDNGDTDIDAIYSLDGSNNLTIPETITLFVRTGTSYVPGANIDVNGGVQIEGTLNAGANAMNVAETFINAGTFTHTGTLTFDGTLDQTLDAGSSAIGSDIVVSNTSGVIQLEGNALNIGANDLTLASGSELDLLGQNLTATGTFSNEGTLALQGSETVNITMDIDSGTVEFRGDGTGAATTHTFTSVSADYYNLTINDSSASNSDTFQAGAGFSVAGALTIQDGVLDSNDNVGDIEGNVTIAASGSFDAGASSLSVAGNWSDSGSFTAGTSTLTLDGTGDQSFTETSALNNVVVNKTSGTVNVGSDLNVDGNLTQTNGNINFSSRSLDLEGNLTLIADTFTAPSSTMTLAGNWSNGGSAVLASNSGLVTFDGTGGQSLDEPGAFNNLTLEKGMDTLTLADNLDVDGDLTVSNGSFTSAIYTIDLEGTFTLNASGDTFTAPSSSFALAGDFDILAGTYTHNSGTLSLDGCNQSITGSNSFYSLSKLEVNNDGSPCTLTFENGTTSTINGTLTLSGLDANDHLQINSDSEGVAATIDFQGSSTFSSAGYLTITDNTVTDNSTGVTLALEPSNSTDGGGTTGWFDFLTVTDGNISISGASGTGGAYIVGDTITVAWDAVDGDGNNLSHVSSVTANLSAWGGGAAVAMTDTTACGGTAADGVFEACYTVVAGNTDTTNQNVSITATHTNTWVTGPVSDSSNATIDNEAPTVSAACISVTGGTAGDGDFYTTDTATAQWDNSNPGSGCSDNNSDISSVSFNLSDFAANDTALAGAASSDVWSSEARDLDETADSSNNVTVTATDDAGNATSTEGTNDYTVSIASSGSSNSGGSNTAPSFTTTSVSITVTEGESAMRVLNANDPDGGKLTWSIKANGSRGTASLSGSTGSSDTVTYTANLSGAGLDSFVVQVSDGDGGYDFLQINVTILAAETSNNGGTGSSSSGSTDSSSQGGQTEESSDGASGGNTGNDDYRDLGEHWSASYVSILAQKNVFENIVDDDDFEPAISTSRAEIAVMLMRYLDLETVNAETLLPDLAGHPYEDLLSQAQNLGLIEAYTTGLDAGLFKPDRPITRGDLVTMSYTAWELSSGREMSELIAEANRRSSIYVDVDSNSALHPYLTLFTEAGIVYGNVDASGLRYYRPTDLASRAEVSKVLVLLRNLDDLGLDDLSAPAEVEVVTEVSEPELVNESTANESTNNTESDNSIMDSTELEMPEKHWADDYIEELIALGVFEGIITGESYGQNLYMSRGQIVTMAMRYYSLPILSETELNANSAWLPDLAGYAFEAELKSAQQLGIIHGYGSGPNQGLYKPHQLITRTELLKILFRAWAVAQNRNADASIGSYEATASQYLDVPAFAWYHPYVAAYTEAGIIEGVANADGGRNYYPDQYSSRGEVSKILLFLDQLSQVSF